ncbi:MAG: FKBP-type peptidyl-prolyl cis-trans isomerase [Actinomycetes bacterium]
MLRRLFAFLAVLAFAAACGSSSGNSSGSKATPAPSGPSGQAPTVIGTFGTKPTITFPNSQPGATLQKTVLHAGTGAAVKSGDLLVVNYLGQIWRGSVFDNSYDRHVATGFPIGIGKVIQGWDKTLVGTRGGSRVLLVVPPADGYGSGGNSQAGIKGTDTLVFVVDVISSYAAKLGGDPHAVPQHVPGNLPKVSGALGKQPTITVGHAPLPTAPKTIVLAKGHGPAVKRGLVIVQYVAVSWTGKDAGSTWKEGSGCPAAAPIADPSQPTPFDSLVGVPVGSRVLLEVPAKQGSPPNTADAVVIDVVAEAAG